MQGLCWDIHLREMSEMIFELDTVANADCLEYMKALPSACVDTVITSPPYAEQRKNRKP